MSWIHNTRQIESALAKRIVARQSFSPDRLVLSLQAKVLIEFKICFNTQPYFRHSAAPAALTQNQSQSRVTDTKSTDTVSQLLTEPCCVEIKKVIPNVPASHSDWEEEEEEGFPKKGANNLEIGVNLNVTKLVGGATGCV